jgi:hypothetical protein
MTSLVLYEIKHCFFVPKVGLADTLSFTNAGASLEMVLKRVTAPEQESD